MKAIPLLLAALALPLGAAAIPDQCLRIQSGKTWPANTQELVYSKLFAEAILVGGFEGEAIPDADHTIGLKSPNHVLVYVANVAGCILASGHVSRVDWDMAKKLTFNPPKIRDDIPTLRGEDEIIPDFKRKQPGGPS